MKGLCPHDRSIGHVCLECPSGTAEGEDDVQVYPPYKTIEQEVKMNSGLDCDYYDFPENIHCAQDMIEWLGLNFAEGNILKSLVRQYGAETKETEAIYEAQKRFYFASRELERVSGLPSREAARLRGTHVAEGEKAS